MLSIKHEGLVQPFQHRPSLAPELLVDTLGVKLPDWQHARLGAGELTHPIPAEFRADAVIELFDTTPAVDTKRPRPVQAIVLEVQLDTDTRKRYSWRRPVLNALGCSIAGGRARPRRDIP